VLVLEHAQSDWDVVIAFVPELDPLERYELLSDLLHEIPLKMQGPRDKQYEFVGRMKPAR
jgi:hypothetical protein